MCVCVSRWMKEDGSQVSMCDCNAVVSVFLSDASSQAHTDLTSLDFLITPQLFLRCRDAPPVPCNMPPTAGALAWCHGLIDRK